MDIKASAVGEPSANLTATNSARVSVNIVGVRLHPMQFASAVDLMEQWISQGRPRYVLFPGSDMLAASQRNPRQRAILNAADLTATDGMMLVRLCRWLGARDAERVYGPDVMLELCRRSAGKGHRHFFYGGAPGVAEELVARLQKRFSGLLVAGTYAPPFRRLSEGEFADVTRLINDSGADIIWVGLSTPKQEIWIADARSKLNAPLVLGVGAAFDFHAGSARQAPQWVRSAGGEWLFRLCAEPRRLWRRYTLQLARFLGLFVLQISGLRQFPLDQSSADEEALA